nr:hypothetical protein [Nocardioides convexus]
MSSPPIPGSPIPTSTSSPPRGWRSGTPRSTSLLAEARLAGAQGTSEVAVALPSSLSATALGRMREDPEAFAREPGPADAPPTRSRRALRDPVPRVGGDPVRPAGALRARRPRRACRRRHRGRRRPQGAWSPASRRGRSARGCRSPSRPPSRSC